MFLTPSIPLLLHSGVELPHHTVDLLYIVNIGLFAGVGLATSEQLRGVGSLLALPCRFSELTPGCQAFVASVFNWLNYIAGPHIVFYVWLPLLSNTGMRFLTIL